MDLGHEGIEVDPPLAPDRHEGEEHVHEHRLAAADSAMDVEAAQRARIARLAEQPAECARLGGEPLGGDLGDQHVERGCRRKLGGICGELALLDQMAIALCDGGMRRQPVAEMHRRASEGSGNQRLSEIGTPLSVWPSNFSGLVE